MPKSALKNILDSQLRIKRTKVSFFYFAVIMETAGLILLAHVFTMFLNGALFDVFVDPVFFLLLGISFILNIGPYLIQKRVSLEIAGLSENQLREKILSRSSDSPRSIDAESFSSLYGRSVGLIGNYYRVYLPDLRKAMVIPVFLMIAVFYADLISGLILLAVLVVTGLFLMLTGDHAKAEKVKRWRELATLRNHFIEIIAGGETMRQLGAVERFRESLIRTADSFRHFTLLVLRKVFITSFVLELMSTVSVAMVAVILGIRLIEGEVSYRSALFVLILIPELFGYIRRLGASRHNLMDAENAAPAINEFLNPSERIRVEPDKAEVTGPPPAKRPPRLWVAIGIAAGLTLAAYLSQMGLLMVGGVLLARSALQHPLSSLHIVIAGVRFFGLARPILQYGARLSTHNIALLLFKRIRVSIFDKISDLDFRRLRQLHSGDVLRAMDSDTETLDDAGPKVVWPMFAVLVTVFLLPFFPPFSHISPRWMFIVLLWLIVLLPWALYSWLPEPIEFSSLERESIDYIHGIKDQAANDPGQALLTGLTDKAERIVGENDRFQWRIALLKGVSMTAIFGLWGLVLLNLAQLDGISISIVVFGLISYTELFSSISSQVGTAKTSLSAYHRIQNLVTLDESRPVEIHPELPESDELLLINSLSWRWPGASQSLFKELNIRLKRGLFYGWVGPVGSGKSTLMDIVTGFHQVPPGSVFFQGYDVATTDQKILLEKVSTVSQRSFVFSGSIRDNLQLANPEISDSEAEAILEIVGLPVNQYDRNIDLGENAIRLSGGERQRLILSRAMAQNREIMLLDEPFNNLDHATQDRILRWIRSKAGQMTFIMITHQTYGLEVMDQVISLFGQPPTGHSV